MSTRLNRIQALIDGGHVKRTDPGANRIQVWDKATGVPLERVHEVNVADGWADVSAVDENGRVVIRDGQIARVRVHGDYELRDLAKGGLRHG